MKKILLTLLMVAMASSSFAVVEGSKHDMRILDSDAEVRICAYCHTPHHANVTGGYKPLWSHDLSIQTFVPYESDTFNGDDLGAIDPMAGPSLLCMSCHDGAIAPDAYYGDPGGNIGVEADVWNGYGVGQFGDMTNDHPIGFDYTYSYANDTGMSTDTAVFAELRDPAATLASQTSDVYAITKIEDVLLNEKIMTCASCHDVHNRDPLGYNAADGYFLYGQQQDSQVCTMCHVK
ncbi:MAG: cytochrome C [Desulfuromonas sp.]|nr:MAG: cytochrome C [Desulfuromonas sp.]